MRKKIIIFLWIFSLLAPRVHSLAASSSVVLISEVLVGKTGAAEQEFVELYNQTSQDVNLTGFSLKKKTSSGSEGYLVSTAKFKDVVLPAHGFLLVAHPTYQDKPVDVVYPSASYGMAANNTVILYNGAEVVDKVGYGTASDFEGQAAANPDAGKSLARKVVAGVMQDTDNNAADFVLQDIPEPQNLTSPKLLPAGGDNTNNNTTSTDATNNQNSNQDNATTTPVNNNSSPTVTTTTVPANPVYSLGQVVINEFVSDPIDNENEFVELYNTTFKEIDLKGWYLEEGSNAKTYLDGKIGPHGFVVAEKINGSLNNTGDIIILREPSNNLIDQVVYGNWSVGGASNAPVAHDPASVARKIDGQSTFNNFNDFQVTYRVTSGAGNIIESLDEDSKEAGKNYDYNDSIIFSEILPNPVGSEVTGEFIELYNRGDRSTNLLGWVLETDYGSHYEIKNTSTTVPAGGYLALFRKDSHMALNNDGGVIKLFQPLREKALISVKYKKALEGQSYILTSILATSSSWQWSDTPTPGKENVVKKVNHAPVVNFDFGDKNYVGMPVVFDTADTFDEDGDSLKYVWDFGDGATSTLEEPEHAFLKKGNFTVKLKVGDGQSETKKEKIIKILLSEHNIAVMPELATTAEESVVGHVIFNEIYPNPVTTQDDEFLEIYNDSKEQVNLLDWKIVSVTSNKTYRFDDAALDGLSLLVLPREESKISLNNTAGHLKLYNDLDDLIAEVKYENAAKGESWARNAAGQWVWTNQVTPAAPNIIISVPDTEVKKSAKANSKSKKVLGTKIVKTTLEQISSLDTGERVAVAGTVAVPPGVFGTQYFYIVGSPGIQVYNYKKDFPALKIGDYIEVQGELTESNGERRLKTQGQGDIKKLAFKQPPAPEELSSESDGKDLTGRLVKIAGEVVEKKGSLIYLDDGDSEAVVALKKNSGVSTTMFKVGDKFSIAGILVRNSSGEKIMPRSKDDVVKINNSNVSNPGELNTATEWTLATTDRKVKFLEYALVILVGVASILGWFLFKRK